MATYDQLVLICGHYEGVDYRVEEHLIDETISIGDFVLTGGELPAMVVADAVARMIPGVWGLASGAIEGFLLQAYFGRAAVHQTTGFSRLGGSGSIAQRSSQKHSHMALTAGLIAYSPFASGFIGTRTYR